MRSISNPWKGNCSILENLVHRVLTLFYRLDEMLTYKLTSFHGSGNHLLQNGKRSQSGSGISRLPVIQTGSDIFRFLGFFDGARLVVLSHAFQKKTQKTPRQAIRLAEERKQDYFRRRKK
jgi:phage-related protein